MATKKTKRKTIVCTRDLCCHQGKPQPIENFYVSSNELNAKFGKYPICKDCLREMIVPGDNDMLFKVLKDMNIAYDGDRWADCVLKYPDNPIGAYFRSINISPLRGVGFDRSQTIVTVDKIQKERTRQSDVESRRAEREKYAKLMEFWGEGFSPKEYDCMQEKYDVLAESYSTPTKMHIENLKNYCKYAVKADMAIANNDSVGAKAWGGLASDAAQAAKLNVSQLSAADLQGGINSFSEVVKAVESSVDIVEILPRMKYAPNDSIDLIIWDYINYARHIQGLKEVSYKEAYKFYEEKKQKFIQKGDPYGFYKDDPTEKNHEEVESMISQLDDCSYETPNAEGKPEDDGTDMITEPDKLEK